MKDDLWDRLLTDGAIVFSCHPDLDTIIRQLGVDYSLIVKWFSDNLLKQIMKTKCRLNVFGDKGESDYKKLLGVTFDIELSFKKHIEDLTDKANQKFHELARLSKYIDPIKSEI